jgi:hypothetical protein
MILMVELKWKNDDWDEMWAQLEPKGIITKEVVLEEWEVCWVSMDLTWMDLWVEVSLLEETRGLDLLLWVDLLECMETHLLHQLPVSNNNYMEDWVEEVTEDRLNHLRDLQEEMIAWDEVSMVNEWLKNSIQTDFMRCNSRCSTTGNHG